jgi:DNA invertase Pin-like site-specific DNA recombinase
MTRRKKQKLRLQSGWVIYKRTSSDNAQAPDRSQESQVALIMSSLVNGSGLPVVAEYSDILTGSNTQRPGYQRMLADARLGKFSHVAVSHVDRFGRNDVEALRAIDELVTLGITIRIASYPGLDLATPDGRMVVGVLFSVARLETARTAQRVIGAMKTKLRNGGWTWMAPDGYINREERL